LLRLFVLSGQFVSKIKTLLEMGHHWSTHMTILCTHRNIKWDLDSRRSEIYSVDLRLAVLENIAFTGDSTIKIKR